jgi:hypothetical protein
MKKCLFVLILSVLTINGFAQKLLVINKIGSPKTTRILPGQRMVIKLTTESTKYGGELEFILEDSIIHEGQKIAIKDIERIIIKNSWISTKTELLPQQTRSFCLNRNGASASTETELLPQ